MPRQTVDLRRCHDLHNASMGSGPIIYWMSRDQRVEDNWALLKAAELAETHARPLAVAFCLAPQFLEASLRHYAFMLHGLREVEKKLAALRIPFFLLTGDPVDRLLDFVARTDAGAVVCDFNPLRISLDWKAAAARRMRIPLIEVDAHNIVPCRVASEKREVGARTLRPKLSRLMGEFLTDFPITRPSRIAWSGAAPRNDWDMALRSLRINRSIPEVDWLPPGETAAHARLARFTEEGGLSRYAEGRNDPCADAQSDLSPYLHFGQLSPQRAALEALRHGATITPWCAFQEQLIVRRELSDNFCFHTPTYDAIEAFPNWARKSLDAHRPDKRDWLYGYEDFELARTHDDLWNAAQLEMVRRGKMHGYLRMYWAKKILEWSPSPEEALATAIRLNDAYELDGRDPNGYAGIAWAIGGVHDRPWFDRSVYGVVRYMNRAGCERKFDVPAYIRRPLHQNL